LGQNKVYNVIIFFGILSFDISDFGKKMWNLFFGGGGGSARTCGSRKKLWAAIRGAKGRLEAAR
jgi:hypothetical protein